MKEAASNRLCFLVQCHRNPAQIRRLATALQRGCEGSRVLIAYDSSGEPFGSCDRRRLPDAHFLPIRGPLRRGDLSLLRPLVTALDWLETRGDDFDWLVYLSGQDYPVVPLRELAAHLAATEYDGFIEHWDATRPSAAWGKCRRGTHRYFYQYSSPPAWSRGLLSGLTILNRLQPMFRVHTTYGVRVGVRASHAPFDGRFRCFAGSQWHTLSRRCVRFLREALRREGELIRYFSRTVCPDEALVQTLLVNSGAFHLCPDNHVYTDFAGSRDGRPRTLGRSDLPTLISGDYWFARKFNAETDGEVLDRLDELALA